MSDHLDVTAIDDLLAANATFAESFPHAGMPKEPGRHVVVVTCMDTRLDVHEFLGLRAGQAHVLRNAGGIVTDDVIRSVMISGRSLGTTEVAVIQHSSCGLCGLDDTAYADEVEADTGTRPPLPLGGFADVDASVAAGVARLVESPLVTQDVVRGFVYDVDTGRLREVP